jgi:hypothetical protein
MTGPYDPPPQAVTGPYVGDPRSVPPYGVPPQPGQAVPWAWPPPVPPHPPDPIDWTTETFVAVVGTVFLALSGAVAGLLWDAAAPKLSFRALSASADASFHPQIGADVWFLIVTALVGLVTAVVLCLVVRRPGPGAAVALAAGGLLGAFVADRVGFVAERHVAVSGLHAIGFPATGDILTQVDFRVRALGVVAGWPLVALAVLGIVLAVNGLRER